MLFQRSDDPPDDSNEVALDEQLIRLIARFRAAKPDGRSEVGRYYAIVITELEKAEALFCVYVLNSRSENGT